MTAMEHAIAVAIGLIGVVVEGRVMGQHVETNGDRERISAHLQVLKTRVAHDPKDEKALNEIRAILRGKWSFARTYACTVLRKLGPAARPAIPELIIALNSGDDFVEPEAARALGAVAVDDPAPVPSLIKKLSRENDEIAWAASAALGNIGAAASDAIPALEKASTSDWDLLASTSKESMAKIRRSQSKKQLKSSQ